MATSNNRNNGKNSKWGLDALLSKRGKSLAVGEQLRFRLVKGPSGIVMADPVSSKAPSETFPLVAKFPESVVKPDFHKEWKSARLYQQDTPKAQDDSDEEDQMSPENKTMRRGWRRRDAPKRQWVLQTEADFLETMLRKRQKQPPPSQKQISSRYEGYPEHNPSHYGVFAVSTTTNHNDNYSVDNNDDNHNHNHKQDTIQVSLLPTPHAVLSFSQPASHQALSLTEAEHAIQDQRFQMTRYMMHKNNPASILGKPIAASKARLMGKLQRNEQAEAEEDDDDVMGDVKFSNRRRGGGGGARKELLSTLAEDGTKVDDDGVLGGTNDAEFGGKRRFGRFAVEQPSIDDRDDSKAAAAGAEKSTVGYDGMAMGEDFYQRDVKAEYEDLDYDANEQFDDDDVDLGETEVVVDPNTGFVEDEDEDEDDEVGEAEEGAEGLATVAGFRKLLAKARGEAPAETSDAEEDNEEEKARGSSRPSSPKVAENASAAEGTNKSPPEDPLAQVMAAAEKSVTAAKKEKDGKVKEDTKAKPTGVELDENGERKITLKSIQNEIWLHHGAIPTKRLMKIFNIKKKTSAERRVRFMDLVKELCIMKEDPVEGKYLVLKQHYSNMG